MRTRPRELRSVTARCTLCAAVAGFSCGNPGTPDGGLSGASPFLAALSGSVRNIVVMSYPGSAQVGEAASCTLEAELFDTTMTASRMSLATDGECTLYAPGPPLPVEAQSWVCAGAIVADYGGNQESLVICPSAGTTLRPVVPITCAGLTPGASVNLSSASEIDGDTVTDLSVTVTLPAAIAITQPTDLTVITWPAAGALPVRWSSANATTALVVLEARANPTQHSAVVCRPGTNGQVSVGEGLIAQAGFRAMDTVLRVFSYRDATTTAEAGHTYHAWAGVESVALLQALH